MPPDARAAPWTALLMALLALLALAPAVAGAADTVPEPRLEDGAWWSYRAGDGADANATVRVLGSSDGADGRTWTLERTTRATTTFPNGSFDVTTVVRQVVHERELQVLEETRVVVRDGTFQGVPVHTYVRNRTSFAPACPGCPAGLPLLPTGGSPGDVWEDEVRATSVRNGTSVLGEGDDARRSERGPVRWNGTVGQRMRVVEAGDVTVPEGTYPSVLVNRSRSTEAGVHLERWAEEPGFLVRWQDRTPNGTAAALELVDHGVDRDPGGDGGALLPHPGVAAAVLAAGAAAGLRRRRPWETAAR